VDESLAERFEALLSKIQISFNPNLFGSEDEFFNRFGLSEVAAEFARDIAGKVALAA